jgi:hypothetical protein
MALVQGVTRCRHVRCGETLTLMIGLSGSPNSFRGERLVELNAKHISKVRGCDGLPLARSRRDDGPVGLSYQFHLVHLSKRKEQFRLKVQAITYTI